ncbi:MAG TPA: hypothetical protein VNO30_50660 [Kofleriaceae bacterium]|nr:hypothetical protein [Kofleriaceae bacterium]
MQARTAILIGAVLVAGSAAVSAFPTPRSWHEPATGRAGTNRAGGGGLYGTGGRTDKGIKCSHCHIKGEGKIGMTLAATPAFVNVAGEDRYVPGTRYTITVSMTGEHKRPGTTNNGNGMAATIEDASGQRAGRFIADAGQDSAACPAVNPYATAPIPAGKTTLLYGDCHGVLPLNHMGLTQWKFDWVAPPAGAGDLKIFIGMVDGDTGGDSSVGDDTLERAITLREGP